MSTTHISYTVSSRKISKPEGAMETQAMTLLFLGLHFVVWHLYLCKVFFKWWIVTAKVPDLFFGFSQHLKWFAYQLLLFSFCLVVGTPVSVSFSGHSKLLYYLCSKVFSLFFKNVHENSLFFSHRQLSGLHAGLSVLKTN